MNIIREWLEEHGNDPVVRELTEKRIENVLSKCITLEEANTNFFPKPFGYPVNSSTYYTLTPDLTDPTLDHVHYWIKNQTVDLSLSLGEGHLYILANKSIPGILKIGYTDRTPQERVKEINSATGVITNWYIANSFACRSPKVIESLVHTQLKDCRITSNKEGFAVNLTEAERIIANIIVENNAAI